MKKLLLLVVLASSSAASFAACEHASDTVSLSECADSYHKKSFEKLKLAYNKSLLSLDEGDKAELKKAQSLWWKFKDTECDIIGNAGTASAVAFAVICKADKAIIREKELRDIYL